MTGKISALSLKATFRRGLGEVVLYLQEKPKTKTLMVPGIHWVEDLQVKCFCSLRDSFCISCWAPASLRLLLLPPPALCWARWKKSKNRPLPSIPGREAQEGGKEARDPGKTSS